MTERFTLLTELGRGGMGVVWKARDEETGQIVALKLLREVYAEDPEYLARFERELELARRIDSVHVVRVLGFGVREKVPYLALEYVDGPSLHHALVQHGPYSWSETRALLIQLTQGLADANAAGVIHRDVKPSNVLIGPDGVAKLTDFGIARGIDTTRMTATSTMLGTPAYLAPEGPKDARSDIYSLGIIGYELLTGAVPFKGTSHQEVIFEHVRTPPDLEKLPPGARPTTGWLLAKNPAERPQSARHLLTVLSGDAPLPVAALSKSSPLPAQPIPKPPTTPARQVVAPGQQPARPAGWSSAARPLGSNAYPIRGQTAPGVAPQGPSGLPSTAVRSGWYARPPHATSGESSPAEPAAALAMLGGCLAFLGAIAALASPFMPWVEIESQGSTASFTGMQLAGFTGDPAAIRQEDIALLYGAAIVGALLALAVIGCAAKRGRRALAVFTAVTGGLVLLAAWSAWRDMVQSSIHLSRPEGLVLAAGAGMTIVFGCLIVALAPLSPRGSPAPAQGTRP